MNSFPDIEKFSSCKKLLEKTISNHQIIQKICNEMMVDLDNGYFNVINALCDHVFTFQNQVITMLNHSKNNPPKLQSQNLPKPKIQTKSQSKTETKPPSVLQSKPETKSQSIPQLKPETKAPSIPQSKPEIEAPSVPQSKPETEAPSVPQSKSETKIPQRKPVTKIPNVSQPKTRINTQPPAKQLLTAKEQLFLLDDWS